MTASIEGLDRIAVEIAPGASPAADPATFDWVSAGSRRTSAVIDIKAGRDDEATLVEAGSMSATMDDRDGNLSPRNVLGQWYGTLRRGTPVRVIWPRTSDDFTRAAVSNSWGTNADGFTWSVSNSAYMSTDGTSAVSTLAFNTASLNVLQGAGSLDVDVVWSFTCPVMPTGGAAVVAALLRSTNSSNYIRAHVELEADGDVIVKVQRVFEGATTTLLANTPVTTAGAGTKIWGRARIEGARILIKAWTGVRGDEPDVWHGSTTDNACEGSGTGIFPWRLNTNVGTFTVNIDDFELTNILWTGNVPEWPVRWPDKSGADSVTPIAAAGVLRQIQQGQGTLKSPLRGQLGNLPYATGYLPLEDQSGSTYAGSGLPGGRPGKVIDGTAAGDDTLPGSEPCLVLTTAINSRVYLFTTGATTNGFAVMCLFKCPTAVPSDRVLLDIRTSGTITRWQVYLDGSTYGFRGYDESGSIVATNNALYSGVLPTNWTAVQLKVEVSGGTVTATLIWRSVGANFSVGVSDSYSGTAPSVVSVAAQALVDGMAVAHLWAGDDALDLTDGTFAAVSNGYTGETAGARLTRLSGETGVPIQVLTGDTEPMGAQKAGKFLDLFRECEAADLGVLYERGNGLTYRPRTRRYTPPVAMALDWSLGHLDEPPEPQDDDQRLRTYITANRTDGSYAVAYDPDAIITYEDSVTLNIESDDRLEDFAAWLLHLGTADELRWPRIRINLVAHPELIPSWLACTIGSRITIANPPSQIAGEVIDLIIEGYSQSINVDEWTVEMACSPARPWIVGEYDSPTSKWGLRSTVTAAEYGPSVTTLTVTTTEDEPLSTTSTYGIMIAGELITVPIGGAGARTGSVGAWSTVITGVTRAVNGVSKTLPAGSPVEIYNTGRWAL